MEKDQKIQQNKQRSIRIILASLFITACVVFLGTLLNMEEDAFQDKLLNNDEDAEQDNAPNKPLRKNPLLAAAAERAPIKLNLPPPPRPPPKKDQGSSNLKLTQPTSEAELVQRVKVLDKEVRRIKGTGVHMEVDPDGVAASKRLQDATRLLLAQRYGHAEPYRVRVGLKFQPSNPTMATMGETASFTIELAPSSLQPHSIFSFLEIARHWSEKKGAFHRRANHVLQVMVRGNQVPHLAFQEYSKDYPHKKGTVGYAGRPSGPAWYVSIQDNTRNHGPGSQQDHNPYEADSCFGTVVEGFDDVVLQRITKMPGSGFLQAPAHVLIETMTILVPSGGGGDFVEWQPQGEIVEMK